MDYEEINKLIDEWDEESEELTKETIEDIVSIILGLIIAGFTAKELSKILPNKLVVWSVALAVQAACSIYIKDGMILGRCMNNSFKNWLHDKRINKVVN